MSCFRAVDTWLIWLVLIIEGVHVCLFVCALPRCRASFVVVVRRCSSLLFVVVVRRCCGRVVASFVRRPSLHCPWLDVVCFDVQRATFVVRCSTFVVRRGLFVLHRCCFVVVPSLCCCVIVHRCCCIAAPSSLFQHRTPFTVHCSPLLAAHALFVVVRSPSAVVGQSSVVCRSSSSSSPLLRLRRRFFVVVPSSLIVHRWSCIVGPASSFLRPSQLTVHRCSCMARGCSFALCRCSFSGRRSLFVVGAEGAHRPT